MVYLPTKKEMNKELKDNFGKISTSDEYGGGAISVSCVSLKTFCSNLSIMAS